MRHLLLPLLFCLCISFSVFAQPAMDSSCPAKPPLGRFFIGTSLDGLIFSTAFIDHPGTETAGKLRFTALVNIGITFNFNINRSFGIYTGLDIKNVGFIIDDPTGGTSKYRTYNVGVPLGFKVGNVTPGRFHVFLGGGIDAPVHYKEKHFDNRSQKSKSSDWFSTRNAAIMPYLFLGASVIRGITVKVQYYPTNFFNEDYTFNNTKPFDNFNVNLLLFSIGRSLPLHRKSDLVTKQVSSLKKQKL